METTVCGHERVKQKLKEGVIPTIFPFKTVKSDQAYQRLNRRKKEVKKHQAMRQKN
jgi:response regulator of citrate/malate metabolism